MKIHYEIWQHTRNDRGIYLERDFMCFNLGDKTLAIKFNDCMKVYQRKIEAYDVMTACLNDGQKSGCVDFEL